MDRAHDVVEIHFLEKPIYEAHGDDKRKKEFKSCADIFSDWFLGSHGRGLGMYIHV